ncbi:MAG: lasso RiPP family leader peptide-containing protein [Gemmatimonadaceae bacterium]
MYKSPELKKLGTFREVTRAGFSGPLDGAALHNDGCTFSTSGRCS